MRQEEDEGMMYAYSMNQLGFREIRSGWSSDSLEREASAKAERPLVHSGPAKIAPIGCCHRAEAAQIPDRAVRVVCHCRDVRSGQAARSGVCRVVSLGPDLHLGSAL